MQISALSAEVSMLNASRHKILLALLQLIAMVCRYSSFSTDFEAVARYVSMVLCSDFERLIVAMTHYLHQVRKRKEPLEEYLGEIMDFVYRKAGVLQEAGQREDDGGS